MSALAFIAATALLAVHGYAWLHVAVRPRLPLALRVALALPVAAILNVLIVMAYTLGDISLTPLPLGSAHLFGIAVAAIIAWTMRALPVTTDEGGVPATRFTPRIRLLVGACCLILAAQFFYAFSHAVLLPTFQYDSATNWTMRSKLSFYDQSMAFDTDERRGMAKPQYPFLFHALQVTANQGQAAWSDRAANAILLLLGASTLFAAFLLLRRVRGTAAATVGIAAVTSVPLFTYHLAQGYGDSVLTQYMILALACCAVALKEPHDRRWLHLSAVFVAGAVWSKSEGLFFALVPWTLMLALLVWRSGSIKPARVALTAYAIAVPWLVFLLLRGLSFTPHQGSDLQFGLRAEGVAELLPALFARGSFGALSYLLPVAVAVALILARKRDPRIERAFLPLLLWSALVFLGILVIYTCTPNVTFLLNAQSFYRQMIIVDTLLILTLFFAYVPIQRPSHGG